MRLIANNIGVDSGIIFIADMDFYKKTRKTRRLG